MLSSLSIRLTGQTKAQARLNAVASYDQSNALFRAFLSKEMMYSCALWSDEEGGPCGDLEREVLTIENNAVNADGEKSQPQIEVRTSESPSVANARDGHSPVPSSRHGGYTPAPDPPPFDIDLLPTNPEPNTGVYLKPAKSSGVETPDNHTRGRSFIDMDDT